MNTGKWGTINNETYDIIENEKDIEKLFNCLRGNILGKENTIEYLRSQLEKAKADTYKDAELVKIKARYEEMEKDYYRGFPISKSEEKAIKEWQTEHEKAHKGGHGAIGGKYTYIFVPTSIGTIGTIKCSCGANFDFQEL